MNDLILITVSAIGGGIVGALGMSWLTAAKVADGSSEADENWALFRQQSQLRAEADDAHTRCADALAAKNDRIDRALECVTENSAHVGKKMAAILKGDR